MPSLSMENTAMTDLSDYSVITSLLIINIIYQILLFVFRAKLFHRYMTLPNERKAKIIRGSIVCNRIVLLALILNLFILPLQYYLNQPSLVKIELLVCITLMLLYLYTKSKIKALKKDEEGQINATAPEKKNAL